VILIEGRAMKLLQKILQVLDGTPAVYGKRQRGQSVLEMAFITPLLIVLIAGAIEVGWFTNNYLILMEITRVGARRATVLEADDSPLGWERDASKMAGSEYATTTPARLVRICDPGNALLTNVPDAFGFFNTITCIMFNSMSPLTLSLTNGEDDIIVSAFSLATFSDDELSAVSTSDPARGGGGANAIQTFRTLVVARYPSNANECTGWSERDPFDYYHTNTWDYGPTSVSRRELDGYDTIAGGGAIWGPFPAPVTPIPIPADPGRFVGFMLTGQHEIPGTTCYGSEFRVRDLETLFNLNNFGLTNQTREFLPDYGITLAEVYWRHELLLRFPAFSPVFNALGNQTTVHVWAAFPTPSIEPRIRIVP
jgi:hypothetical protein